MPQRFTNPAIKYTTDTLKTMPGALLYFYENGTSTPKAVYQDIELGNPHPHPVVAFDNGVFPPIFLDGTYRVELKNALGVTQSPWPIDDIGGEEIQGQFDDWSSITNYQVGDLVTASNGLRYVSIQTPNLNQEPSVSPLYWEEVRLSEDYNPISTYAIGEWVLYGGNWYKSILQSTGQTPAQNSQYWDLATVYFSWNQSKTYALNDYVFDGNIRYISKQAGNINHQPSMDSAETWWKPDWQAFDALTKIKRMTGGGALTAYMCNVIEDGNTGYTLPLANTVPDRGWIVIAKSDTARTLFPEFSRSGSDTIRFLGGTDTAVRINTGWTDSMILFSNGLNQWSF